MQPPNTTSVSVSVSELTEDTRIASAYQTRFREASTQTRRYHERRTDDA
jgi:hypothetical protein